MTRIEWEEDKTAVAALVSSALYLSVGLACPVVTLITSRGSQGRDGQDVIRNVHTLTEPYHGAVMSGMYPAWETPHPPPRYAYDACRVVSK